MNLNGTHCGQRRTDSRYGNDVPSLPHFRTVPWTKDTIRCCRHLFSPWTFRPSPNQGHTGNTSTSTDTRNQHLLVAPAPCFPSTPFQTVYTYLNMIYYLCAQLFRVSQVPYVRESSPQLEMTAERPRMPVENARAFPTCAPMM